MNGVLDVQNKPIKRVGLFVKWRIQEIKDDVTKVLSILKENGCAVTLATTDNDLDLPGIPKLPAEKIGAAVDCILVLGGDGTMLYAARRVAPTSQTPLIGVHLGKLGFMTQLKMPQLESSLKNLIAGRYRIKERMLLETKVLHEGKPSFSGICLNEVAVHREHIARLLDLRIRVQGMLLSTIRGDGVIIATPQGSTAYSLSAGGPIVHPAVSALVITSLCPHTLTNRPVVIPPDYTVHVEATDPSKESALQLTLDGQDMHSLQSHDIIEVKRAQQTCKLIDLNQPGKFFETLREKLHWGI